MTIDIDFNFGFYRFTQNRKRNHKKPNEQHGRIGYGWETNNKIVTRLTATNQGYLLRFAMGGTAKFEKDPRDGIYYGENRKAKLVIEETSFNVFRNDKSVWCFERQQTNGLPARLLQIKGADNRAVFFEYDSMNRVKEVRAFDSVQEKRLYGTLSFNYDTHENLSDITVKIADRNGVLQNHSKVSYEFYHDNEQHGNQGDLKMVTQFTGKTEDWEIFGVYYYRYYRQNESRGHHRALKSNFIHEDFSLLQEKFAEHLFDIPDTEAMPFVTAYFEYDKSQRTMLQKMLRGTITKHLIYENFSGSEDQNCVRSRRSEIYSDGRTRTAYKNKHGKTILQENTVEYKGNKETLREFLVFDRGGNVLKKYFADAIQNFQILDKPNGKYIEIEAVPDQGQIISYQLYSETPRAKRKYVTIQKGELGQPILLRKWNHLESVANKKTTYRLGHVVEFPNETEDKGVTTSYQYGLFENSAKVRQKTTLLPIIPESENGDGQQVSQVEVFDLNGRTVWSKNESGVLSHSVYDPISKRMIRQIEDVDITKTEDFGTPLPEDWKTPNEAGKHDVTDYFYDFKGRLIKTIRPESEGIDDTGKLIRCRPVSWTIYDERFRTQRSASGYLEIDDESNIRRTVLANPVSITIQNAAGNMIEQIQASRENLDGELLETDVFEQMSFISWTKYIYHFGGNLVAVRQYHKIPESGEGLKGTHYAETLYDYDIQGRRIRTVSPLGTISRTVYDSAGNAVQQWVGTNDIDATESEPHSSNPVNDMRLVSETEYGHSTNCSSCGGGGNDRVLIQIQHAGEGKIRTTEFKYDWRGRQTHTLSNEEENGHYIQTVQHYDNLDRVVKTEQYLCREKLNEKKSKKNLSKTNRI